MFLGSQKHQKTAHKRNVADENKLKSIERENELLKKEILKLKTDNKRLRKERSEALGKFSCCIVVLYTI